MAHGQELKAYQGVIYVEETTAEDLLLFNCPKHHFIKFIEVCARDYAQNVVPGIRENSQIDFCAACFQLLLPVEY